MKRFDVKRLGRLVSELAVLLALYFLGCQLATWGHLPIPGGVVGMALQLGAGVLMAEMLLFFIPALMSLLDYGVIVRDEGWRILLVIGVSTLLVMVVTAFTVEAVCRWRMRHEV